MNPDVNALPPWPDAVAQAIEGKDSGTASTLLAVHRNRLSMRRTRLSDLRSHLSNENTHLSYLRTMISLVVFGLTLNQFSQFLQDQGQGGIRGSVRLLRNTEQAGAGMLILGLLVAAWSLCRYWQVRQGIRRGNHELSDAGLMVLSLLLIIPATAAILWIFVR